MPTFFVGYVAPRFVAGLAGLRDRAPAPGLFARFRVERGDHARLRAAFGLAASARDDLAVRDDRTGAVLRALAIIEDERLPNQLARARIERVCVAVGPVVENQVIVDREIAIRRKRRQVLADVLGDAPPILPKQITRRRVEALRDVIRIRKEHHAVVHERRAFLIAWS